MKKKRVAVLSAPSNIPINVNTYVLYFISHYELNLN